MEDILASLNACLDPGFSAPFGRVFDDAQRPSPAAVPKSESSNGEEEPVAGAGSSTTPAQTLEAVQKQQLHNLEQNIDQAGKRTRAREKQTEASVDKKLGKVEAKVKEQLEKAEGTGDTCSALYQRMMSAFTKKEGKNYKFSSHAQKLELRKEWISTELAKMKVLKINTQRNS